MPINSAVFFKGIALHASGRGAFLAWNHFNDSTDNHFMNQLGCVLLMLYFVHRLYKDLITIEGWLPDINERPLGAIVTSLVSIFLFTTGCGLLSDTFNFDPEATVWAFIGIILGIDSVSEQTYNNAIMANP